MTTTQTATVVCAYEFGPADKVARVETQPLPALAPGQVLVRVLAAPINPADLNVFEGTYGVKPPLPVTGGIEGVGLVIETGQRVIAPMRRGWWSTLRLLNEADLIVVPDDVPRDVAAMLTINPPTAYRMLHDFVSLQPGEWIIQNAANSGVGHAVIQIARQRGWRTINVVRRPELIEELRDEGADVVVTDKTPLSRQIATLTGGAPVRLGLNAVGGESARQIAKSLAPGATLVTYGAMARQPLQLDNGMFIFRDLTCRGFWLGRWYDATTAVDHQRMFDELFAMARAGKFRAPVAKTYPLAEAPVALAHSAHDSRAGKILFAME
jgi:NADPH:quinone reductase-like Zn-dependent oxidoreductase